MSPITLRNASTQMIHSISDSTVAQTLSEQSPLLPAPFHDGLVWFVVRMLYDISIIITHVWPVRHAVAVHHHVCLDGVQPHTHAVAFFCHADNGMLRQNPDLGGPARTKLTIAIPIQKPTLFIVRRPWPRLVVFVPQTFRDVWRETAIKLQCDDPGNARACYCARSSVQETCSRRRVAREGRRCVQVEC